MTDDPYKPPSSPVVDAGANVEKSRLTWGQTVSIWWSCAWRGALYAFPAGFVWGFAVSILKRRNFITPSVEQFGQIGMYAVIIVLSIAAMKHALEKHLGALR